MTMSPWAAACGLLAGAVSTIDAVPYVRDILRGSTRPHRATWGIWSVLGITAFLAQAADGASWSLLMVGVQAASMSAVFGLSLWRGIGRLGRAELALLAVAAGGVIGWSASSEPVVATLGVVVADLAAVVMMLPKTWRDPDSETPSAFLMAGVAGLLGMAAVGAFDPSLLLYPAYFALANLGTAALIMLRRRALSPQHGREQHLRVAAAE
jgi:hypothetical protein